MKLFCVRALAVAGVAVEGVLVVTLGLLGQAGAGAGRVLLHLHHGADLGALAGLQAAAGHHDGHLAGPAASGDTAVGGVVTGPATLGHQQVTRPQLQTTLSDRKKTVS